MRVGPAAAPVAGGRTGRGGVLAARFPARPVQGDAARRSTIRWSTSRSAPDGSARPRASRSPSAAAQSNVSIANANVVDGAVHARRRALGQTYAADEHQRPAEARCAQGPFSFQGSASSIGAGYDVRVGTGKFDDDGGTTLSLYLKRRRQQLHAREQRRAAAGHRAEIHRRRSATGSRRRSPRRARRSMPGAAISCSTGKLEAAPTACCSSNYTALPDENRPATRLTGAAELEARQGRVVQRRGLGRRGGAAAARRDQGADRSALRAGAAAGRDAAAADAGRSRARSGSTSPSSICARCRCATCGSMRRPTARAGPSRISPRRCRAAPSVGLTGNLSVVERQADLCRRRRRSTAQQLDRLAALWRKPPADNPLFDMPAR